MNKEFVPYEQALELKELGIDQRCYASYGPVGARAYKELSYGYADYNIGNCIGAPTFSQAFRWFREEYNIFPIIQPYFNSEELTWNIVFMDNYDSIEEEGGKYEELEIVDVYEKAELACLKKLIEIVKSKTT